MSRSPDSAVFKVTVIGSHDSQIQNEGTLETTPTSIVYTDNQGSKFTWQLSHVRKYGSNGDNLFTIETGSSCPTGPGVYIFSTPHAPYLESIIARYLNSSHKASPDPDTFFSLPRNGFSSAANGRSMLRSASLWTIPSNQFPVRNITEGPGSQMEGVIEVTQQEIVYTENKTGKQYRWPITFLRRFGYDGNVFSFDASRRCQGGGGVFAFISNRAADIQDLIRKQSKSGFGSTLNLASPQNTAKRVPLRSEDDDTPVFRRTNSFLRRARSAMDLNRNLFDVVNISDDRKEVGKGELEVTQSDLIYIDRKTEEKWRWPLRYLRRYGCDGNVFSFEAGRRCPGGEGLYAFSCERAAEIHEAIVSSISGPQKTAEPDFRASNMSLVDPSLMSQRYNRRGSEQLPVRKNNQMNFTPPSRQQIPLPKTPSPPRSPQISERSVTPRGSVSSPSLDENDTSSVSSGVLTPPISGMGTPPPKPPRNKERKKKAKKVKTQEKSLDPGHMYDDPVLVHNEYLESQSAKAGAPSPLKLPPIRQKPIPPPKPQSKPEKSPKAERKGKDSPSSEKKAKKEKQPAAKRNSLLNKFLKRKSIGPSDSNEDSLPEEAKGSVYENLPETPQPDTPQPSMYANVSMVQSPKHHSMYANIPRQGSVGRGEVSVFSSSLPASSSVPMPHRGDTPPLASSPEQPLTYQNVELKSPPANTYANVELRRDKPAETFTPTKYTEIEIVDGVIPYNGSHDKENKSHDKQGPSHDEKTPSHDKKPPSHDKKRQSSPALNSSVDINEEVAYQSLNFRAMKAVETLHQQRGHTEQFAEILDRHTLKQDEVKALSKTKKHWS